MMIRLFFISLLLSLGTMSAQTFEVKVSESEVLAETPFELAFVLTGGEAAEIAFPPLDGFEIISGPDESPSMVNVNGSLQQQTIYRFQLQAARPGSKRIGPATATLGTTVLSTDLIEIRVSARQEELSPEDLRLRAALERSLGKNIRVEATPSSTSLYEGEPFTLTYDLWVDAQLSSQVGSISRQSTPQFQGFSAIIQPSRTDRSLELKRGKRYLRTRISEYRLIAQSPGRFQLDTLQVGMTVAIPRSGRRPQNDLEAFQRQFKPGFREYRYLLASNSPAVTIKALPSNGKPVDFSGLVGNLNASATLSDTSVQTGEELHLVLRIEGEADYGLLSPPVLQVPPGFESYPPRVTSNEDATVLELDYTLVAREPGGYSLEFPEISYFDPARKRYRTIGGGSVEIIAEGESLAGNQADQEQKSGRLEFEDRLLKHPEGVKARAESWIQQWFWWVFIGLWSSVLLLRWWTRRRQRLMSDPDWVLDHRFRMEVKEALAKASSNLNDGLVTPAHAHMYQVLSLITGRFLGLPIEYQTERGIHEALSSSEWTLEQKKEFADLTMICQRSGYGGKESTTASETLSRLKKLLYAVQALKPAGTRRSILTIILMITVCGASAQNSWDDAAALITNQQYVAAAKMYDSLYESGLRTVDLFHNWGTASYRNGDPGRAIWAYEKALRMEPGLDLTRNNLEVLRREVGGDILPRPDLPFERDWKEIVGRVGPGGWSWLVIGLSALLIAFLAASWWHAGLDRIRPRVMITGIAILAGLLWIRSTSDPFSPNGEGIILSESVVREAPEGQQELIRLEAGVKVYLGDKVSGWCQVTLLDPLSGELTGFVPSEVVEPI